MTEVQDQIQAGQLKKLVLAQRTQFDYKGLKADQIFAQVARSMILRAFLSLSEGSFGFYFQLDVHHAFGCHSPELLFSLSDRHIESEALAGTQSENGNAEEQLLNNPKLLYEQSCVEDYVRERFNTLCHWWDSPMDRRVKDLGYVRHSFTSFRGVLSPESSAAEAIIALHPTPAVAGVRMDDPADPNGLRLIRSSDGFDRGWYAGAVGWIGRIRSVLSVGIRAYLIHGHSLDLYVGAGIVRDSDPDQEWAEIQKKKGFFLQAFEAVQTQTPPSE